MNDRGTGKTTRQIKALPTGAVFVWCSGDLHYPKALARSLSRQDVEVVKPIWLTSQAWRGRRFSAIEVDHAALLNIHQEECLAKAKDALTVFAPKPQDDDPLLGLDV